METLETLQERFRPLFLENETPQEFVIRFQSYYISFIDDALYAMKENLELSLEEMYEVARTPWFISVFMNALYAKGDYEADGESYSKESYEEIIQDINETLAVYSLIMTYLETPGDNDMIINFLKYAKILKDTIAEKEQAQEQAQEH